ncbi:DUF943 family protein [Winslowiella iniecta]|uniref:DUF943 family protein n=2 Tax=Winslowiella iniecta TaxID=1560201 RepID=UPI00069E66EF|nr:DUF943 family protein [Winslowiella iniecta]
MKKRKILLIFLIIFAGAVIWRLMIPVEIIDIHSSKYKSSYDIIVKNLPLTDKGKIQWWEKNKEQLRLKYNLSIMNEKYDVNFFVAKYKIDRGTDQDSDLLCFDDMNAKANCIEKDNQPMTIWYIAEKGQTIFLLNNWKNKYIKYDATGRLDKVR